MNDNVKGGQRNRRPFRQKDRNGSNQGPRDRMAKENRTTTDDRKKNDRVRFDKVKGTLLDRPKWTPPKLANTPLPKQECPYCGKLILDLSQAITDPTEGKPVHFDCAIDRIAKSERLMSGDVVSYIGGGRFGILHFDNSNDPKSFQIKKIFQWEEKDKRAPWRKDVADRYSST